MASDISTCNMQDSARDRKYGKAPKNKKTKVAVGKAETSSGRTSKLKEFNDIFFRDTLDQTADFSGGFTPYRKIALKKQNDAKGPVSTSHKVEKDKGNAVRKTKVKEKSKKKKTAACNDQLTIPDNEDQAFPTKSDNVGDILEKHPAILAEGGTSSRDNKTSNSCAIKQNRTESSDLGKNVTDILPSSTSEPSDCGDSATEAADSEHVKGKVCRTCGKEIPLVLYQTHLSQCLRERFQHAKKPVSAAEERNAVRESEFVICQFCQEDITGLNITDRQQHVQTCLEERGLVTPTKDQAKEVSRVPDHGVKKEVEESITVCHLCGKNLSHLNTQRCTQHVNRCIDQREKDEEKRKEEAAALERARNKVLDCPICGQHLKTLNSRKNHLKKCANNFKIPLAVLKERVKEQEEEHQLKLSAGILPEEKRPAKRGRPKKDTRQSGSSGQRNVGNALPDEATQLALALSSSLKEEEERKIRDSLGEFIVPPAPSGSVGPTGLDAFSILMSPSKPRSPERKKGKKKKKAEVIPRLVMLSSEKRAEKLAEKVASVLLPQDEYDKVEPTPPLPQSRLKDQCDDHSVKVVSDQGLQGQSLWGQSSLLGVDPVEHRAAYYVSKLVPPISPCKVQTGSKIKRMSVIPGRQTLSQENDGVEKNQSKPSDLSIRLAQDSTLVASTQTAVLLAELAGNTTVLEENGNETIALPPTSELNKTLAGCETNSVRAVSGSQSSEDERLPNGSAAGASSGFCQSEEIAQDQSLPHVDCLLSDLGQMVNSATLSDLQLRVKDNKMLHVHKFILAARCPQLLKLLESRVHTDINLENYTSDGVLALLHYLYTGNIDIPHKVTAEVQKLALRLNLNMLYSVCEDLIGEHPQESCSDDQNKQDISCVDKDLNDLLKAAWGSDSEDSDSTADHSEDNQVIEQEEDEIQELYEYMATQRQKSKCENVQNLDEVSASDDDTRENENVLQMDCDARSDVSDNINKGHSGTELEDIESHPGKQTDFGFSDSDGDVYFTEDGVEPLNENNMGLNEDEDRCLPLNNVDNNELPSALKNKCHAINNASVNQSVKQIGMDNHSLPEENESMLGNAIIHLNENDCDSVNECVPAVDTEKDEKALVDENLIFTPIKTSQEIINNSSMTPDLFGNSPGSPIIVDPADAGDGNEIVITNVVSLVGQKCSQKQTRLNSPFKIDDSPKADSETAVNTRNKSDSSGSHLFDSFTSDYDTGIKDMGDICNKSPQEFSNTQIYVDSPDVKNSQIQRTSFLSDVPSPVFPSQHPGPSQVPSKAVVSLEKAFSKEVKQEESDRLELSTHLDIQINCKLESRVGNSDTRKDYIKCSVNQTEHVDNVLRNEANTESNTEKVKVKKFKFVKKAAVRAPASKGNISITVDNNVLCNMSEAITLSDTDVITSSSCSVSTTKPENRRSSSQKRKHEVTGHLDMHCSSPVNTPKKVRAVGPEAVSPVFSRTRNGDRPGSSHADIESIPLESLTVDSDLTVMDMTSQEHKISDKESEDGMHGKGTEDIANNSQLNTSVDEPIDLTQEDLELQLSGCTGGSDEQSLPDVLDHKSDSEGDISIIEPETHQISLNVSQSGNRNQDDSSEKEQGGASESYTPAFEDQNDGDVWEGFDDVGGFTQEELEGIASIPCTQLVPSQNKNNNSGPSGDAGEDCEVLDYDPPTDMDTDVSLVAEDSFNMQEPSVASSNRAPRSNKDPWKTPKVPGQKKKKTKPWIPPSPFTPMPNYDSMPTPDLKDNCKKFGVRILPKKKMRTALKHIYQETHKYETDSECESFAEPGTTSVSSTNPEPRPTSSCTNADSSGSDLLEELMVDESDEMDDVAEESYISSTQLPKGKDKESVAKAKKEKVREYVLSHDELYLKVLMYEPLDLEDFRQDIKDAGINIGCGLTMDALDEMNITFSMRKKDESGKAQPRRKQRGKTKQSKGDNKTKSPKPVKRRRQIRKPKGGDN